MLYIIGRTSRINKYRQKDNLAVGFSLELVWSLPANVDEHCLYMIVCSVLHEET